MRRRTRHALAFALALFALRPAVGADAPDPSLPTVREEIAWVASLATAYEQALKEKKPVFVAINAARVDGGRPEPAGAMLRDEVYKAPAVVAKSREFVCALLRSDGNSADYGELRSRYAIDGQIVSPQHILAHADGTLIQRREYWEPRGVDASVEALLAMMDAALAAHRARKDGPGGVAPTGPGSTDEQRAAWIRELLERVRQGSADPSARDAAVKELVRGDKGGDCVEALMTVLVEAKKDLDTRVAILKALGRPGLEIAVTGVAALLDDREEDVRSNAAVTLEYIGSARAVEPLLKRVGREKEEAVANNVCRALGRCGAKQEAVRKVLLREMNTAKSDRALAGPVIGLAYFEKDADVARALEKAAKKEERFKRGFLLWALTEVRDPKSAEFVKKEILPTEKNALALAFDNAVYAVLSGDDDGTAAQTIDRGMGWLVGSVGGIGGTARRQREDAGFSPKGEFAPSGGPPGGRGPGGMGG